MANGWKIGDTVKLKSGGPGMTVIGFTDDGKAICDYFSGDGKPGRGVFPPEALKPDED